MPVRREAEPRRCSIAAALDVVGERWSVLVVRELSLGVRRFNDIAANTGAPRDILTTRLRKLEELGVVDRRQYSDRPPRFEYVLTPAGHDLRPVLMALKRWGDEHVSQRPLPLVWEHTCGHEFVPEMRCKACGEKAARGSLTVARADVDAVDD
jgi:DNA-binding HxlR family transcriptional regulator